MKIMPPIDPIPADVAALMARHNITAEWLNRDDGDPYATPNLIRSELASCDHRIPWHYRHATLEHPEIRAWVDELIDAARNHENKTVLASIYRGRSLMILGPTGTGKTYLTYAAVRDIAMSGVMCGWTATTAADLYAALRPRAGVDSETEFRKYADARLLIVDDIGAAKDTEWTEEINYRLINTRYEHFRPTIVTSNVPPAQLTPKLGERVSSRLIGMCQRVVLKGDDRRKKAAA